MKVRNLPFCEAALIAARVQSNNVSHKPKIIVRNSAIYPDRDYMISKIHEVQRYSIQLGFQTMIKSEHWQDITPEELVDQYYSNVEDYFDYRPQDTTTTTNNTISQFNDNDNTSDMGDNGDADQVSEDSGTELSEEEKKAKLAKYD